jgi:hypothetical protein
MAADYPLSEKVKNDTEVTADLATFVAEVRRYRWEIAHYQGWQKHTVTRLEVE